MIFGKLGEDKFHAERITKVAYFEKKVPNKNALLAEF